MLNKLIRLLRFAARPIYRFARPILHWITLTIGIPVIRRVPKRYRLSRPALTLLKFGWGNPWAASVDYIEAMIGAVDETSGPIVECGSGLTTLVLGLITSDNGRQICVLEHDPAWHRQISRMVGRHSLVNVGVHLTPLRSYGPFHWYDLTEVCIPNDIAVVICDGPPGSTIGGRYGLLPVLRPRLKQSCIILLDDAGREEERKILERWSQEYPLSERFYNGDKPFTSIKLTSVKNTP